MIIFLYDICEQFIYFMLMFHRKTLIPLINIKFTICLPRALIFSKPISLKRGGILFFFLLLLGKKLSSLSQVLLSF